MTILKKGSNNENVKLLQRFLKLKDDGDFGDKTEAAVKAWQKKNGLKDDGVVGPKTWEAMGLASTDISERVEKPSEGLVIEQYFLPKDEYLAGPTDKEYVFLHHTAGGHNPYQVVDMWARDTRGRIATEFVLGGQAAANGNTKFDGKLIQCLPTGAYGWHLGDNGSMHMHKHSVGIEVCNFGYVVKGLTYANTPVDPSQIVTLPQAFRGHKTWHKYSDLQISTLKQWILFIAERDNIDVRKGLIEEIKKKGAAGFEWNENAYYGRVKGMWTHTNTRKDKVDMFPQPELIDMLLTI
jgi:hypothetical protein